MYSITFSAEAWTFLQAVTWVTQHGFRIHRADARGDWFVLYPFADPTDDDEVFQRQPPQKKLVTTLEGDTVWFVRHLYDELGDGDRMIV